MGKYAKVRDGLVAQGLVDAAALVEPAPAGWDDLALVHTPEYLEKTRSGGFRASELALLELPWSPSVTEGFRLMAGGTIAAARLAVEAGAGPGRATGGRVGTSRNLAAAANLGGGFHHAFPSHGEGFCLYNDVAVAIRVLQRDGLITRAAVVDVDVHQGNGTAFIFDGDPAVFTFSIHQEHNYPHVKPRGSLDVGLPDGTGDHDYLHALERALPAVMAGRPDLIVYVAGADPFLEDQLGGLCLTYRRAAGPRRPRPVVRARGRHSRRDRLCRRLRAARRRHRGHPRRHDRGSRQAGSLTGVRPFRASCGARRTSSARSASRAGTCARRGGPATAARGRRRGCTQRVKRPSSCSMSLRRSRIFRAHLDVRLPEVLLHREQRRAVAVPQVRARHRASARARAGRGRCGTAASPPASSCARR